MILYEKLARIFIVTLFCEKKKKAIGTNSHSFTKTGAEVDSQALVDNILKWFMLYSRDVLEVFSSERMG